jgi:hypothetical protein
MKKTVALLSVVGLAGIASAAGTLVINVVPQAASIGGGGTMILDIFADYSGVTGGLAVAGWKFDVMGNANGTLAGDVNDAVFGNGVNNGAASGANLLDYAGGQLPGALGGGNASGHLGTVSYTDAGTAAGNYSVSLAIADYVASTGALNVYITASGSQSRSSLTSSSGTSHLVTFNVGAFDVIIPTPASMALLGLGGLVAGRRRR